MRGLYVDSPDGETFYTSAGVIKSDARELVDYVLAVVAALSPMLSDEVPARLVELATEHPDSFREAAALGLELAEVAPDQAAEHVRAMLRGEVPSATDEDQRRDE